MTFTIRTFPQQSINDQARRMYLSGMSPRDIADRLGVSVAAISPVILEIDGDSKSSGLHGARPLVPTPGKARKASFLLNFSLYWESEDSGGNCPSMSIFDFFNGG